MINIFLIFLIKTIRPLLGPALCKFSVSCTTYAYQQLKEEHLHKALWNIIKRVLSCNPFTK